MPIIDSLIRQIICDADGCTKKVIYDKKDEKATFESPENAWLKTSRVVQSADGRNHVYCSDSCELVGAKTGKHNLPEAQKVQGATAQEVSAAVAMAKARADADAAIRAGGPAKVQITDN